MALQTLTTYTMSFCQEIEQESGKAYKYFQIFWDEMENKPNVDFENLPFEMQLGVFIAFFNSNSIDFQMYASEMIALQESVKESFQLYEEYLFLDS